jgi:hypothetical protein
MQGVLGAAVALAIAGVEGRKLKQRVGHLVDMRSFLHSVAPNPQLQREMFGGYASNVATDHEVAPGDELGKLAAGVTAQMRKRIARGEPLLNIPVAWQFKRLITMDLSEFRSTAEASPLVASMTFAVSNLGELDSYVPADGPLRVDEMIFLVGGSVANTIIVPASALGGATSLDLVTVEPMVPYEYGVQVARRVKELLLAYGQQPEADAHDRAVAG